MKLTGIPSISPASREAQTSAKPTPLMDVRDVDAIRRPTDLDGLTRLKKVRGYKVKRSQTKVFKNLFQPLGILCRHPDQEIDVAGRAGEAVLANGKRPHDDVINAPRV